MGCPSTFPRLAEVAECQPDAVLDDIHIYVWRQNRVVDEILLRRLLNLPGGLLFDGLHRFVRDVEDLLLRTLPVASKRDRERQFVPYIIEAEGVVVHAIQKNPVIWDMHQAPGALVGVDPAADFHERRMEQPHVDDIALDATHLDPVAVLVWSAD